MPSSEKLCLQLWVMVKTTSEKCPSWCVWQQLVERIPKCWCNAILAKARNYAFMLNFDFFQPMKHQKDYSVGVFYSALLNLPRAKRFKWENNIVIGIVPSFDKEPKDMNQFLEPAVDELKALWKGIWLKSCVSKFASTFHAAVISISSDVPATTKICGFQGHSAIWGCSCCLREFLGSFGEKRYYFGFDRNSWKPRTNQDLRTQAVKMTRCKSWAQFDWTKLWYLSLQGLTWSGVLWYF